MDEWLNKMIKQGATIFSAQKAKEITVRMAERKKNEKKTAKLKPKQRKAIPPLTCREPSQRCLGLSPW